MTSGPGGGDGHDEHPSGDHGDNADVPNDAGPDSAMPSDAVPDGAVPNDAGPDSAMPSDAVPDGAVPNDEVPTVCCRVCDVDVPAGKYCGLCGVTLTPEPGDGPEWLRKSAFGAAPDESLFRMSVSSTLFPHLPTSSRTPFRLALGAIVLALTVFGVLRMPAALITVAALGLPLLFVLYLHEIDAQRDLPTRILLFTALLGIGLGVGWVLLTGSMIARSYGVPLGSGIAGIRLLQQGLGIPLITVLLAVLPAVLLRLSGPPTREALDGFMIGALGALAFAAAATLTRLAPQFATGMVNRGRPMAGLLVEAGIRGVSVPVTAAAAGGLIGAALWFTRPPSKAHQHPGVVRLFVAVFGLSVAAVYALLGLVDVAGMPQTIQLACHLAMTLFALFALRIGLQLALLHEAHDEIQADQPILCPHCGHVVPDMAFCPACGAATRASSRSSRDSRRQARPVRVESAPGDA